MLAHKVQLQTGHHAEVLATGRVSRRVGKQYRTAAVKQLMVVGEVAHAHLSPGRVPDLSYPRVARHDGVRRGLALGRRRRLARLGPHALHFVGSAKNDERLDSWVRIDIARVGRGRIVFDLRDLVEEGDRLLVDAGFDRLGQIVGKILRFLAEKLLNGARHVLGVLESVVGQRQSSTDHGREDQGQDERDGRAEALASCAAHVCPTVPRQA